MFNSIPVTNNAPANFVLGQSLFTTKTAAASPTSLTMNGPQEVSGAGTTLLVSDLNNERILVFDTIPTANDPPADVEIGQPDMLSKQPNQGLSAPSSFTLSAPNHACFKNGNLYVADAGNSRVLVYNGIPSGNDAAASLVVGQPDMVTATANTGGINFSGLNVPDRGGLRRIKFIRLGYKQ